MRFICPSCSNKTSYTKTRKWGGPKKSGELHRVYHKMQCIGRNGCKHRFIVVIPFNKDDTAQMPILLTDKTEWDTAIPGDLISWS